MPEINNDYFVFYSREYGSFFWQHDFKALIAPTRSLFDLYKEGPKTRQSRDVEAARRRDEASSGRLPRNSRSKCSLIHTRRPYRSSVDVEWLDTATGATISRHSKWTSSRDASKSSSNSSRM